MFHTEIHIKGALDPDWSDWFGEMQIRVSSSGDTILTGDLQDKSAVYGIISRLSSLGITLISVNCDENLGEIPHQEA
jgi:hypothetical protein